MHIYYEWTDGQSKPTDTRMCLCNILLDKVSKKDISLIIVKIFKMGEEPMEVFVFFVFTMLKTKSMTSPHKYFTTELHPQPLTETLQGNQRIKTTICFKFL